MSIADQGQAIPDVVCWQLLGTLSMGRIALSVQALPEILPVQYRVHERELSICLGHREMPLRSLENAVVAFAADSIDPLTRSGWLVQVVGRSSVDLGDVPDTTCGEPRTRQALKVRAARITGQYVHLCPFIDWFRLTADG